MQNVKTYSLAMIAILNFELFTLNFSQCLSRRHVEKAH